MSIFYPDQKIPWSEKRNLSNSTSINNETSKDQTMNITSSNGKQILKLTKSEWKQIGKTAGWKGSDYIVDLAKACLLYTSPSPRD